MTGAEPLTGWDRWPSLRLGSAASSRRGRIQTAVRRAFIGHDILTTSQVFDCLRSRPKGELEASPSLVGDPRAAPDVRSDRPLSRSWPPLDLAAQGARHGYAFRVARLKSLEKWRHGQSCPYCRPCSRVGLAGLHSDCRAVRAALSHLSCASHEKAAIGWRNLIRWTRRGADHENDDEGAAFCGAQIGASDQGAVRSGDGGGECSTGTGDGNRSAMCGAA
jgi:hypothetical protein